MIERTKAEYKPTERELGTISYVQDPQSGRRFLYVHFTCRNGSEIVDSAVEVNSVGLQYLEDVEKPIVVLPDKSSPSWESLFRFAFGEVIVKLPKGKNILIKKYEQQEDEYWKENGVLFISADGNPDTHTPPNQSQVISIHTTFHNWEH